MIEIVRAPAHLVVQDAGFVGQRKIGLPRSGAMDPAALALGNALVGNNPNEAALEWAVTGGAIRFDRDVTVALTGARVHGRAGTEMLAGDVPITLRAGTVLEVDRFVKGRFLYLCVSPPPKIQPVFNSRSTYTPALLGGFNGRRLRQGDKIEFEPNSKSTASPFTPQKPDYSQQTLRIVAGPQHGALGGRLFTSLLENTFSVSTASDRTGYRLEGPILDATEIPQILSEPACEGAVQITNSGLPIILMADGPTIGGYNKIAVVVSEDLPLLAQKNPGEVVRFRPV